jgi:catechol 2,3-dioxygenase-like lactoylglutathione lyase family enzyme
MIRYEQVHHVSLNVTDLQKAKEFYTDVLCLREMERPPLKTRGVWFSVGEDGQQLHLIEYPGETLRQGGIDGSDGHYALRVQSYSETIDWLTRCGVEFEARPHAKTGFPQIYLLDPDRNVIELNAQEL